MPVGLERLCQGPDGLPFYTYRISARSPERVANTFKFLSDAGLDGMAIGLVNYIDDFPFFRAEVLPRMERLGLRTAG